MRTTRQLPAGIPRETDFAKFPDSTVINATETAEGTPIVREIYGDVLTNIYKLIRLAGIVPSGVEDNELNGYQLVDALNKFSNDLNDVEQPMQLTGTVFSVGIDLAILPDKYVCVVRSAEAFVSGTTYTFKGNVAGGAEYAFTCPSGFVSGDVLLLVIDAATVRAYNLSNNSNTVPTDVFTPFGIPLAFNSGNKIFYQSEGVLFSDLPEAYDLQSAIRVQQGDGTIIVYEMVLINGFVICLTFSAGTTTYKLYKFSLADLNTPIAMTFSGTGLSAGTDRQPNIYTNGVSLYISNASNSSANNYAFNIYSLNMATGVATFTGSISLDPAFEKTTNAVVTGGFLFTLIGGTLVKYNLSTGARTSIATYPGYIGTLFGFNAGVYYSNDEVAKKWTL